MVSADHTVSFRKTGARVILHAPAGAPLGPARHGGEPMRDAMRCSRLVFAVILTLLSGTLAAPEAGPGVRGALQARDDTGGMGSAVHAR